ncbi:hypothetical protein DO021_21680 [Desulfobacter hydrogenophilus]|uniref:VWA-like domain-containing protein n=1 Tax=Desulfobacter hydrogenophilus TaxID=2291 RepID=A0A328F8G5_9BACT|nr:hypothetical protein [Desulfobacter hydrogenophilus]QBH15164.1 hypothetical protein EYB58_20905 [Desulfobacter hydrogenophilus]RAL99939.1 hypothetical protein DO021_21680 [Desulfobacter hydrogenophilus]
MGLTAHTVMHPACAHHLRRGDRNADTWNSACDYAINPILLEAGLILPDGFLYDPILEGKSAEQVYTQLTQGDADESHEEKKSDESQTTPSPAESHEQNQEDQKEDWNQIETAKPSEPDTPEPDNPDHGPAGEVRDGDTAPSPGGTEETETDWEQALVQAAATARIMGQLPKGVDIFIKERFSPSLPWTDLLARFIQQSARSDYTWSQPNRRYIHQDIYFPALVSDQLPEMAVAVDTSGSIRPEELERFSAELSAILSMNPARVHILFNDLTVSRYETVCPWDLPFDFTPKGGGGTDFRPVFQFIDENQITPFCLIFFSDMECRLFPAQAPDYPVLWIRTGQGDDPAPFGDMINLISEK